jgi:hypothetical protein
MAVADNNVPYKAIKRRRAKVENKPGWLSESFALNFANPPVAI